MWLARNQGHDTLSGKYIPGDLYLYMKKPKRANSFKGTLLEDIHTENDIWTARCPKMKYDKEAFSDLKYEDEPIEVDLDIKYNRWSLDIYKYLLRIKEITDTYKNPLINDSGGASICNDIDKKVDELIKMVLFK